MKIRLGFVSNSSSSSFLVGVKKDKTLSRELFFKSFNINHNSAFTEIGDYIATYFNDKFLNKSSTIIDLNYCYKEFIDYLSDEEINKIPKEEKIESLIIYSKTHDNIYSQCMNKIINDDWIFSIIHAYNDSDNPIEIMLYNIMFCVDTEDVIIAKEDY